MIHRFPVADYDLAATLECGQDFRWDRRGGGWEGVVSGRWVRLEPVPGGIRATALGDCGRAPGSDGDWEWLTRYLRTDEDLAAILSTFPDDPPLREAVAACRGLRLVRQDPWECLAGFICSSTKQIVQIRQILRLLAARWGKPVRAADGSVWHALPRAEVLAGVSEGDLRACKLGFRAPYLRAAAERVAAGHLDLDALARRPLPEARAALEALPGVGRKIADCVLLFGLGFPAAFPVDVWVRRALRELYFPRARRLTPRRILRFSETHFGPHAGYAQQYLFHYRRTRPD